MDKETLLEEIREHAQGLMSLGEIADILETEINDPEMLKAYDAGHLLAKAQVWKSVQKLAASGSGPAQELALKRIQTLETKRKQYE
jgi:hypothetical protein